MSPARAAAFAALRRLRASGSRLDESAAALPELSSLSTADRGLANELVNGTVKRRGTIDAVLGSYTKAPLKSADPDVRDALRLAAFQLLFLDRVPAYAVVDDSVTLATRTSRRAGGFVNAVLRRVAADGRARLSELAEGDASRDWSAALSYPLWLVKLLREELGDAPARRLLEAGERRARALPARQPAARRTAGGAGRRCAVEGFTTPRRRRPAGRAALRRPAARALRRLPRRARDGAVARLADRRHRGRRRRDGPGRGGPRPLRRARRQDQSAGGPAARRRRSRPWRWTRSAPKTCARNLARLGADDVEVVRADALDPHPEWEAAFDAVLLDAPCSGLGTLASRADLRWRRHLNDVPRLAQLQARLLARAAATVKPGGALTYAVCTLTRAETLGVVEPLLGRRRLDGRRPRRGLAGAGASGGRRLPARAAAGRRLQRLLRRSPASRRSRGRPASRGPRGGVDYRCGTTPRRPRIGGDRWKTSCAASTWRRRSCPPTSAVWATTSRPCSTPAPASSTSTSWTVTSCPTSPSGRWW